MKIRLGKLVWCILLLLTSCKSTKFVPDNQYLLDKVAIQVDNKKVSQDDLRSYLRQTPNTKVLGLWRLQLGMYNISGRDTTKWINRAFRKMGDPPVIYDPALTKASTQQLRRSVQNLGFFNAQVDSKVDTKNKKAKVTYDVRTGQPHLLNSFETKLPEGTLRAIAMDTASSYIKPEMYFDVNVLDAERARIVREMKNSGYYYFEKEYLHYTADSTEMPRRVDLELALPQRLQQTNDSVRDFILTQYKIRNVVFHTNYNPTTATEVSTIDTIQLGNYIISYSGKHNLRPAALISNCFVLPGATYNESAVERTYASLNSLAPINYVNMSFHHVGKDELDCYVVITPNKMQSFSVEGEGTFSGGDWGVAAGLGYTHRNLFRGAEVLSIQGRTAYEWRKTTGNALEAGGDIKLTFPSLLIPFMPGDKRRSLNSNTEIKATYQYQKRPTEYSRTIAGVGIKYAWSPRQTRLWHGLDLFEFSYVQLPWMSDAFKEYLAGNSSVLKYQYEDHLIMRIGYNGSYSNYNAKQPMRSSLTVRYGAETAGNLLYGIHQLAKKEPGEDGIHRVLNVPYAQYVKGDFDFVYNQVINPTNRLVYHASVGIGYPYGNAQILPFEKRYYSGGSNSVRGWTVRTLGPGIYQSTGNRFDFNNQTGDIKLDLSLEYRAHLFWLLEGALFFDAGNIWTIHEYPNQVGGVFKVDEFYKQLAMSYGLGLRFDFSFFILRFDFAVKLHDPGLPLELRWRKAPTWKDDMAFHFAIGYPF